MTGITQHPTPEPATYDEDFCIYHKTRVPVGQTCSFCRVESENRLFRTDTPASPTRDTDRLQSDIGRALHAVEFATRLERAMPIVFVAILCLVLITGNLMCSNNRRLDAQVQAIERGTK